MKALVLAAGLGQRLLPITQHIPKPLVPLCNEPLVGYALRFLKHHGIEHIAINTFHLGKMIQDFLGTGGRYGVNIHYSVERELLGTGGGLKALEAFFQNETFVIYNSDILIDLNLSEAIDAHKRSGALATMVLRPHTDANQSEIEVDPSGAIVRILGQGKSASQARNMQFTGLHILEPRFLKYLPQGNSCIVRQGYSKALNAGELLQGFVTTNYWADLGTCERLLSAQEDLFRGQACLSYFKPKIENGNCIAASAKIDRFASIGPHCSVGQNVKIGPDAKISHCIVLGESVIDAGEQIERAIVSPQGRCVAC